MGRHSRLGWHSAPSTLGRKTHEITAARVCGADRSQVAEQKDLAFTLDGKPYTQQTQKYHRKSLAALRARYAAVTDKTVLAPILAEAGCLTWLE